MDFETIATLLLLLFYLLFQMRGRKKRPVQHKQTELPGAEQKERPSFRTELEEALREIRQAMEPTTQPVPEPVPVPDRDVSTRPRPELKAEKPLPQPAALERVSERRQKSQVAANQPALKVTTSPAKVVKHGSDPKSPTTDTDKLNQQIQKQSYLSKRLKNPETVREAIVISEILGRPLSKRR